MAATLADDMSGQHQAIDARLARTSAHLDGGDTAAAARDAAELAAALRHHIRLEEEHLFPAYARAPAADLELLAAMRNQHAEIAALVQELEETLAAGNRGPALAAKAALHAALGTHDDEEEALCAALDRTLDGPGRAQLVALLRR